MTELRLGLSPCPNDTFIFHALLHGLVPLPPGISVTPLLEDVETLNQLVLAGELPISKISYHLLGHVRDRYLLLRAGSALGRGCGPLLVAREAVDPASLRGAPIAIPGRYTTAALLLRLYDPQLANLVVLPFHRIMPAIVAGEVAAGVIIHESRFTYPEYGLHQLLDLGSWWESSSGHPIPLGGIVARRDLAAPLLAGFERGIAASVRHAQADPATARPFIRTHAQEMSDAVCQAHIDLYVNDYSVDLGESGLAAVHHLLRQGEAAGLFPPCDLPLCLP